MRSADARANMGYLILFCVTHKCYIPSALYPRHMPPELQTTVEEAREWYIRSKKGEPVNAIARSVGRGWRAVKTAIEIYDELLKKGQPMAEKKEGEGESEQEDDEDVEADESGGDEVPAPHSETEPRTPAETPAEGQPAAPVTSRPRQRPTFRPSTAPAIPRHRAEEPEPEEEIDEGQGAPTFRSRDNVLKRRLEKLKRMLPPVPGMTPGNVKWVMSVIDADDSVLNDSMSMFTLLSRFEKVDLRDVRRVIDIIFSEPRQQQDPSMYAPMPDGNYVDNTYDNTFRGGYTRAPQYGGRQMDDDMGYQQAPPQRMPPQGSISRADFDRIIELERRAAYLEAQTRQMRQENRQQPPPPAPPREDTMVEIKRPVVNPQTGEVIDYQIERVPRDVYMMQMEKDRNEKMFEMMKSREKGQPEQPSAEITALREQVKMLSDVVQKKERDGEFKAIIDAVGTKLSETNRNYSEMTKALEDRLKGIESRASEPSGGGGMSDEASVIIQEIKSGSELTRTAILEANKTLNNAIEVYNKASKPNKGAKDAERRKYSDRLEEDEVRVLNEELEDTDVEES